MAAFSDIILANSLAEVGSPRFRGYLCHAYCSAGSCRLVYNGRTHVMQTGDCMILSGPGELMEQVSPSEDFSVEVVYVTQAFIETATPPGSNYGMRGHLALFDNPIISLTEPQQLVCQRNFAVIRERLAHTEHHFYRELMRNVVQTMILDFFEFHASRYGYDVITTQYRQLMDRFLALLERGDYRTHRDLAHYADALCITTKYLSEVSRKVSGFAANYWITRYTSLSISRELRNRERTISEISEAFGFSSTAHFHRFVQKNLGAKPSEFRQ